MNKLSTQTIALLVLLVSTLAIGVYVTNRDLETDVITANASELELHTPADAELSVGYSDEWVAVPSEGGAGYVFTLKEPLEGLSAEAQPQIRIDFQNLPYADAVASAQTQMGGTPSDAYTTIDNRREGLRYSITQPLGTGEVVVAETVILNPNSPSVPADELDNRTVFAQLSAEETHIADYRQTFEFMLDSVQLGKPFSLAARDDEAPLELTESFLSPDGSMSLSYPTGWTANVDPSNPTVIGILSPEAQTTGVPLIQIAVQPLESSAEADLAALLASVPLTLIEPMTPYTNGDLQGFTAVVEDQGPDGNSIFVEVAYIELTDTQMLTGFTVASAEQLPQLRATFDAIAQTFVYTPPVVVPFEIPTEEATETPEEAPAEVPTEEATVEGEPSEAPTEEATEAPTEVPTEEATPAN